MASEQANSVIEQAAEEKKPGRCAGCGLPKKDGYRRAPHETAFELRYITAEARLLFVCQQCRTKTHARLVDTRECVECRNCGDEIPETLQGNHVCESHPLGKAAEPRKSSVNTATEQNGGESDGE